MNHIVIMFSSIDPVILTLQNNQHRKIIELNDSSQTSDKKPTIRPARILTIRYDARLIGKKRNKSFAF